MSSMFRMIASFLTVLAGVAVLSACTSPVSGLAQLPPTVAAEYSLEPGDKIRVTVQDMPSANGDYIVDDSGVISFPLIRDIAVRGKSYREVEQAIERALLNQQILTQPVVTVQPLELRPFYVLGEVNKPGQFEYRQGMTVLAAISVAGGYTYRAKTDQMAITRTVNGEQVVSAADENATVMPGDRIRVYERWF